MWAYHLDNTSQVEAIGMWAYHLDNTSQVEVNGVWAYHLDNTFNSRGKWHVGISFGQHFSNAGK